MPSAPVLSGLAIDSNCCAVVTLEDGQILCFGQRVLASRRGGAER